MIDSEIQSYIQREITKQVLIILSGQAGANDSQSENIDNLYPSMPSITGRPVMHPFGMVSRAPNGTISVTARQGDHPGNRMVLGHRDSNRPTVNEGEVILYNQFGQQIYLESGKIHIGKKSTSDPAVVGNELKAFLISLIGWLLTHTHVTSAPGAPTSPPQETADLNSIKSDNVTNDKILSQEVFIEKGP